MRLATLVAGTVGAGVLATPALADDPRADVTSFTTRNVAVSSQGCRSVPVKMNVLFDLPNSSAYFDTTISRGGRDLGHTSFQPNQPDTWFWCGEVHGFGTFTIGPSKGDVSISDDGGTARFAVSDRTVGHVKVKVRSAVKIRKAYRAGGRVVVVPIVYYYDYAKARWLPWGRASVLYQQYVSGRWSDVGYLRSGSDGAAAASLPGGAKAYRVMASEGAWAFGSVSPVVSR